MDASAPRTWTLLGADGHPSESERPGACGGHRRARIYGRLDCPAARRAIARGGYVADRVFFADEAVAVAAGLRRLLARTVRGVESAVVAGRAGSRPGGRTVTAPSPHRAPPAEGRGT